MKKSITTILIAASILASCTSENDFLRANQEPVKYEYTKKVVIAKRISDRAFLVAFNDGQYANIGFGWYSCVKVGDTVVFKHLEDRQASAYNIINPCKN